MKPKLRVIEGGLLADSDQAGVGAVDAEHSLPRQVAEGGGRADAVEVEEEPILPLSTVQLEEGAHAGGAGLLASRGEEDDAGGARAALRLARERAPWRRATPEALSLAPGTSSPRSSRSAKEGETGGEDRCR